MPSNQNTVALVVISFLLVILIYSSIAKFDAFAKPILCIPLPRHPCEPCTVIHPCTTGSITNGQTGPPSRPGNALPPLSNNTGAPPALSITKEVNLARHDQKSTLNSRQTTTCPNGLPPDANGNCPTTSTNQQAAPLQSLGGSASSNNNPTSGHHHKGSNQPTQTGGQETITKKHKEPKTDQGTTQSRS